MEKQEVYSMTPPSLSETKKSFLPFGRNVRYVKEISEK